MGGPEADGREGEVDVLARLDLPGARDAAGHAHGFGGEDLDGGAAGVGADVAVEEGGEPEEPFDGPEGDDHFDEGLGWDVG